jgi:hypothetical protein
MSSDTRRIPGERLTARVLRRGTVRPSIGTPAAFYERFGLADPLAERGFVAEECLNDEDGLYSFLSAEPYYAALRAQASWRSSGARRRLLGRIAAQSDSFSSGATRRRVAPDTAGVRRFSLGSGLATDSMLTTVERPVSREELIEELEAEGWTPAGERRRESPTRRLRRKSRRLAPAAQSLLETIEAAAPATRRAVQHIRQQIVDLGEDEQVIAVKQLAKGVRGPLRRLAVAEAGGVSDSLDMSPVAVAADRGNARASRRKGLRPVLHGSPTLKTLMFDDAIAAPVASQPRLRPVSAPRPAAAGRRVSVASASRDVRQQVAAGRAGPRSASVSAISAEAPRADRVQPMVRAARRSRAASIETILPTARGTQIVEPATVREHAAQTRLVRRASIADVNGPLTASPTSYVNDNALGRRAFRRPTVARPSTRLQTTMFAPASQDMASVGRTPGVSRALASQSESVRRPQRMVQTATGFQYARPAGVDESDVADTTVYQASERTPGSARIAGSSRTAGSAGTPSFDGAASSTESAGTPGSASARTRLAPLRAESHRADRVVSRPTARAARRLRGVSRAPVTAGPVIGGVDAPVVRHAAAFEPARRSSGSGRAPASPARRRHVHLAPSPADFVQLAVASDTPADVAAPLARSSRPTTRALERANIVSRVDERDVALHTASPARYVRQRTVASEQPLSKSPVRRIRTVAPDSVVLRPDSPVSPASAGSLYTPRSSAAVESPTARLVQRSTGATAQLAASDRLPTVASKADAPAARRRVVVARAETGETVAVGRAQRPVRSLADTPTRRTRIGTADGTLLGSAAGTPESGEEAVGRASTDRSTRRIRMRSADGTLLAPTDVTSAGGQETAVRSPGASSSKRRPAPVRVQDVEGRLVRKAAVGTGSVVYAAARVEQALAGEEDSFSSSVSRRPQTPLAVRRRRSMRPVGYASASRDFSLLVPQVSAPSTPVERARTRTSAPAGSGSPSIRIEASGRLSRADLDSVLKQVSGVVRALERAERPRVATPVAQRVAQHQPEQLNAHAPTLSRSPVSRRVGKRAAARTVVARGVSKTGRSTAVPSASSARRSRSVVREPGVLAQSALVGGAESADEFTGSNSSQRYAASSSVAHAESRATSSNTYGVAPSRLPAQRRAAAATEAATSVRSPSSARVGRPQRAVSTSAGRRPGLSQTLGRIARSTAPVGTLATAAQSGAVQDDGRAWSQRAETGSGIFRGAAEAESGPRAADGTPLGRPAAGTVLHALARATSAEDVVRVIMERADGLRGISKELPGPAVELVKRIVRATDEAQVLSANVMPIDELAPLSVHNRAPSSDSEESFSTQNTWNGQRSRPARRSQAGAGQSMRLANKLMQLVHLAENERRLADAQQHVRMAQEGEKVDGGGGEAASGEAVEAPNLKALQREVYEAVLREMELSTQRGQGGSNGSIWW